MALITRFSNLIRADAHAVLDQIEDPLTSLRQAVRDMRTEVRDEAQQIELLTSRLRDQEQQYGDGLQAVQRLTAQLEDALDAQRDDLARTVIRHRLQQTMLNEQVDRQLERSRETLDTARRRHRDRHAQLESMQQKLNLFARNSGDGGAPARAAGEPVSIAVTEDQVELELVREKKQRSVS